MSAATTTAFPTSVPATAPGTSTASTTNTSSTNPDLPARPTSLSSVVPTSQYSPYGGAPNSYGAGTYGGGASAYGNSYGGGYGGLGGTSGYGGGYGGMGYGGVAGGYGGGMGYGGGGYNRFGSGVGGMMGPNGGMMGGAGGLQESTAHTFQLIESVVGAFSGFAQMLDSTYMATHSSFFAMMAVAEQFGHLRNSLGSILGIVTVLRWIKNLAARFSGRPVPTKAQSINAQSFLKFQANGGASRAGPRPSFKPLLFFLAAVFGMPYLLNKLIRTLASQQEQQIQQQQSRTDENGNPILTDSVSGAAIDPSKLEFCRAMFDFTPENPQIELQLRKGDLVAIIAKTDPSGKPSEWWRVRTRDGRSGYVPSTYVEPIPRRIEPVEETTTTNAVDDIEAQKAKNKAS